MPVKSCTTNGKPGFQWGNSGKCYPYTPGNEASMKAAKKKAIAQGVAAGYQTGKFDLSKVNKELADVPSGYMQPWAVCKLCGFEAYGPIDGVEPQLTSCPICGSFMEDPSGYVIKKTTEDALRLHYAPWK